MSKIAVLPENVRNLIAAGEVVERPASVVKELVENAIDAGAGEVRIEVARGGLDRIVIADDGCGMDEHDMRLSIERHATSKLGRAADLLEIRTMGFRGEALPSIAAVSKMTIETRSGDEGEIAGHYLVVEGGNIVDAGEKGLANGTRIIVENLFYNVPARKKFMRTPRTELGHIKDMAERLALANPGIRFRLVSDGKELVGANMQGDEGQRASEIFGVDVVKKCRRCEAEAGEIRMYGLVGEPSLASEGGYGAYWFVNRRPVRDRILNHAASEAFRSLLPRGVHPFSMLYITMPPGDVDVNVHPAKSEVRFLKGNAVHDFVLNAVRRSVSGQGAQTPVLHPPPASGEAGMPMHPPAPACRRLAAGMAGRSSAFGGLARRPDPGTPAPMHPFTHAPKYSSLRPIGQLHSTFILCEGEDGKLVVIDQHAAHERIGYEKLKEGCRTSRVVSQRLLIPEVVSVPSRNAPYLEDAIPDLDKLGWEIDHFGGETFTVKAVPEIIGDVNLKEAVSAIALDLADHGKPSSHEEKIDMLLRVTACHMQVRAGDKLSNAEVLSLLREMDEYEWSERCPHGRPAVAEVSKEEIGKWFAR